MRRNRTNSCAQGKGMEDREHVSQRGQVCVRVLLEAEQRGLCTHTRLLTHARSTLAVRFFCILFLPLLYCICLDLVWICFGLWFCLRGLGGAGVIIAGLDSVVISLSRDRPACCVSNEQCGGAVTWGFTTYRRPSSHLCVFLDDIKLILFVCPCAVRGTGALLCECVRTTHGVYVPHTEPPWSRTISL